MNSELNSIKDTILQDFINLQKSLEFNANFEIPSERLGEDVSVFPGSTGKGGMNGIVAIVRKDYYGEEQNWVLTGFGYDKKSDMEKNREATEAIQTVIAKYGQSLGYSYFRDQVGAVLASLDSNIPQLEKMSSEITSKVLNAAEQSASAEINTKPSKEEKTMAKQTEQTNLNVSEKKDFSGNWIPYHNAKVIKEAIENGTAPFLPDKNGNINAVPLYNANTGHCLNAKDLIPLQIAQKEGYSGIVATKNSIEAARSSIKAKETGFFYNFKREDGSIGTTQFFFPEQTEHPDQVIEAATKKIAAVQNRINGKENATQAPVRNAITITSADPKEYLASYVAACKTKSPLKCDPAIAEQFKKNLDVVIQNQFAKMESFNPEVGKLNNLLFEADKKSLEIVKQINKENRPKQQTHQKQKKQEQEITF